MAAPVDEEEEDVLANAPKRSVPATTTWEMGSLPERLARLRGPIGDLAPAWMPPQDQVSRRDPWLLRLTYLAAGSAVLLVVLWVSYGIALRGMSDGIRPMVPASAIAAAAAR